MRITGKIFATLALLGLAAPAAAQETYPRPGRIDGGQAQMAYALAAAEHVIELVRTVKTISVGSYNGPNIDRASDLRVSLVVLDLGPATDVSPRQEIHLAMFNDINEHGVAWTLEPIASVWEFKSTKRTAPGIYEIRAVTLNYGRCTDFETVLITVDARNLSVAVRNAPGLGEFDTQRYIEPVGITIDHVKCGG